ncbi:unnamed protein product, partial [Natator depressus]
GGGLASLPRTAAARPLSPGPRLHEGLSLRLRGCEGGGEPRGLRPPPAAAAQGVFVEHQSLKHLCTILSIKRKK